MAVAMLGHVPIFIPLLSVILPMLVGVYSVHALYHKSKVHFGIHHGNHFGLLYGVFGGQRQAFWLQGQYVSRRPCPRSGN